MQFSVPASKRGSSADVHEDLTRTLLVIQEHVTRLDEGMFNGILRDPEDDVPTDPLADPSTDLSGCELVNIAVSPHEHETPNPCRIQKWRRKLQKSQRRLKMKTLCSSVC
ncbi:hypothetical protein BDL97_04G061600 [Sphagnum fallax]|nr:hypothetical protein BDL97_04G061600 [Sphagnum fallax]